MNECDGRSQAAQLWKQLYRAAVLETNIELEGSFDNRDCEAHMGRDSRR
jgi:hypothetical protein